MTEIQIKNLIKEYEKEYIEFMEIEKLPQYKIDFFEINVEESDAAGFASAAQAYYNTKTDEHILRICKSSEIPRYIVFHEFTHILDTEMYAKQDSWKYMALSGYTEYHAAQVELMIMLGADSIQTQDFSFTVDVEIGNSTVRNYLNSRHQLVVNMMNRTDFPRDIEALKTTVGVLYNYFGVRSICKMYAKDYTEEVDNTIIIQKRSKVLFEEINSFMALSGYTEYHAAQVELMIMLGADSIQTQDFSFTVDVEIGNSTVRNYLNSRHQLVVNMMNRTDFPRDIEALKTTVGVLYNYFGVRSICKMYAKDYTEEVDNTIIIQKLSKVLFEEINSFMVGWFNEAQVELSFVSYMKIMWPMLQSYFGKE